MIKLSEISLVKILHEAKSFNFLIWLVGSDQKETFLLPLILMTEVKSLRPSQTITAERIERLLLPQYWKVHDSWERASAELIRDFSYHLTSSKILPDLSTWSSSIRPTYVYFLSRWPIAWKVIDPSTCFDTPLFAWCALPIWKPLVRTENMIGLFHVLMQLQHVKSTQCLNFVRTKHITMGGKP